ncbi:MAG: zinc ribbon domain-containing protein [Pyrinomonadaceae bacterium]
MEPEISRRCPSCGASVRARAFFCPQCGEEIGTRDDASGEAKTEPLGQLGHDPTKDATEFAHNGSDSESRTVSLGEFPAPTRELLEHRTAAGAHIAGHSEREALADVHGVEKLRQISGAVLDEASYDPSLRFVLVAAVLFVLFLVLVIASELIA